MLTITETPHCGCEFLKKLLWIVTQTIKIRSSKRQQYPEHTNVNIPRSPHSTHGDLTMHRSRTQSSVIDFQIAFCCQINGKHWQSCIDSSSLRSWLSDLQPNLSLKSQHATCLMAETRQLHGDVDDGITAARGQSFNKYRGSDRNGKKLLGTP